MGNKNSKSVNKKISLSKIIYVPDDWMKVLNGELTKSDYRAVEFVLKKGELNGVNVRIQHNEKCIWILLSNIEAYLLSIEQRKWYSIEEIEQKLYATLINQNTDKHFKEVIKNVCEELNSTSKFYSMFLNYFNSWASTSQESLEKLLEIQRNHNAQMQNKK